MKADRGHAVQRFQEMFLSFEIDSIKTQAQRLLDAGITIQGFLSACMPCMEEIGRKFEAGEYYLPQLVVAGEMFKTASREIRSVLTEENSDRPRYQIVLGTPAGDIHDLGKDIFAVLAEASGFKVHNLGVDVKPETFVTKLKETGAGVLGLSSLLTTTFESICNIVDLLKEEGLRKKTFVIIGGGVTEKSLIGKLSVDAQTRDAYEGINLIRNYIQTGRKEVAV